jgi:hypothetical protein
VKKSEMDLPLDSSNTVIAYSEGFVEAEVDLEVLALSIERGICYGMNGVASRIWNLLAKPIRIDDLCAELLAAYKVEPDVCEREVLELLEDLRAEGLILKLDQQ